MAATFAAMRSAAMASKSSGALSARFALSAASTTSTLSQATAQRAAACIAIGGLNGARNQSTNAAPSSPQQRRRRRSRIYDPTRPLPTAEEAVNNILYNTVENTLAPSQRHILNCLVTNEPGVLSRVSGILAARGFNIDSLIVAKTEVPDLSRMTVVLQGQDNEIEQARRQLEDLVPVWAVLDYTKSTLIEREMLMVKVSTVPGNLPEELSEEDAEKAEEHGTLNTEVSWNRAVPEPSWAEGRARLEVQSFCSNQSSNPSHSFGNQVNRHLPPPLLRRPTRRHRPPRPSLWRTRGRRHPRIRHLGTVRQELACGCVFEAVEAVWDY